MYGLNRGWNTAESCVQQEAAELRAVWQGEYFSMHSYFKKKDLYNCMWWARGGTAQWVVNNELEHWTAHTKYMSPSRVSAATYLALGWQTAWPRSVSLDCVPSVAPSSDAVLSEKLHLFSFLTTPLHLTPDAFESVQISCPSENTAERSRLAQCEGQILAVMSWGWQGSEAEGQGGRGRGWGREWGCVCVCTCSLDQPRQAVLMRTFCLQ